MDDAGVAPRVAVGPRLAQRPRGDDVVVDGRREVVAAGAGPGVDHAGLDGRAGRVPDPRGDGRVAPLHEHERGQGSSPQIQSSGNFVSSVIIIFLTYHNKYNQGHIFIIFAFFSRKITEQ